MRVSHSSYKQYIENLAKQIDGESLYSPLLLNNKTIVLPFMERQKEVLMIVLNPKCPLLFKCQNEKFFSSFENSFLNKFRKHIGKSIINNLKLKDDDLVVSFDLYSIENDEHYKIIVELIPNHPNFIVLNEDNNLCDHYFSSKDRVFEKGKSFIPLTNEKLIDGEIEVNEELFNKLQKEEYDIRIKEKYAEFTKFLHNKIRSATKRISAIEGDVKKASENLIYQEIADDILTSCPDLKAHQKSIIYQKKEYELDESKTLLDNSMHFYKKAKKAKETIERANLNIENAQKEKEEYENILNEFVRVDENKKDDIVSIYSYSKKKKETKPTVINRPWKINLNGTIIYFGRNASQNDYLSFVMKLDREFTWLHIKDKPGAHIVIANKKPTDNELLTACELALICSRAQTGEIAYTKKKNVRRGHVLGEAILKNQSIAKLNVVRKETFDLFANAVRCN